MTSTVKAPVPVGHGMDSAFIRAFTSPILLNALKEFTGSLTRPVLIQRRQVAKCLTVRKGCIYPHAAALGVARSKARSISGFTGTGNSGQQSRDATATYSVHERFPEVLFIVADMLVNLVNHSGVVVPHERRQRDRIVALQQLSRCPAVASEVTEHFLAGLLGEAKKAVANGVFRPGIAALVPEKLAVDMTRHQASDDFERNPMQVDDALRALALALLCWKDDALTFQLHMARLNRSGFLGPASGMPDEHEEIPEGVALCNKRKQMLVVLRLHVDFAPSGRRLLHPSKGSPFEMSLLYRPIPNALHSDDGATGISRSPGGLAVRPFRHVKRLDGCRLKFYNAGVFKEVAEVAAVPFQAARSPVFFAPSKILRNERMNCKSHALLSNQKATTSLLWR